MSHYVFTQVIGAIGLHILLKASSCHCFSPSSSQAKILPPIHQHTERSTQFELNAIKNDKNSLNLNIDLDEDLVNDFCQGTNEFWKQLVIKPVRDYVQVRVYNLNDEVQHTQYYL